MSARAVLALLALCLCSCACGDSASAPSSAHAATLSAGVRGTVVDAATRAPVAGASVTAPDGSRTQSDDSGRFQLDGLALGLEGELVASRPDGRVGRLPLRPLRPGYLEVVVHLRGP